MNKIKKFLHMIISFAFAFVLAIGGIGIKSAKVAKAEETNLPVSGFLSDFVNDAMVHFFEELPVGDKDICILVQETFFQNMGRDDFIFDHPDDPFVQELVSAVAQERNFPDTVNALTASRFRSNHIYVYVCMAGGVCNDIIRGFDWDSITDYTSFAANTGHNSSNAVFMSLGLWEIPNETKHLFGSIQYQLGGTWTDMRSYVLAVNNNGDLDSSLIDNDGNFQIKVYEGNSSWVNKSISA